MKKLFALCALVSLCGMVNAQRTVPHALSELFIARIINQSDGIFRIYLSDQEVDTLTIMPHSTAELHTTVVLSPTGTIWVYPIKGSFQTIFAQLGSAASGTCDLANEHPVVVSFWYDNPSLPLNQRTYRRLCMGTTSALQVTITHDGSVELHTVEVANID